MTMEMVSRQNAEWQSADLHNTLVTQLCKLSEHKHKKCNTLMLHNRWTDTNVAHLTQACRVWIGDTTHVHNTQKKCSIHIYETQQCNSISKCKMHVCKAQVCNLFTYIYIHKTKSLSISTVGGSGATSTGNFFELFFQNRWSFYGPVDPKHAKNFKKVKKTPKMHWHHTTQMVMETLVTSG